MGCAGVDESLPVVQLSPIAHLQWALARCVYTQPGIERALTGVALWAVTTHLRRTGHIPATQLSQLDKHKKGAIGLVRGVKKHAEDSLLMEVWFLQERVEREAESEAGEQAEGGGAAAGRVRDAHEGHDGEGNSEADIETETVAGGGGRKRRKRGSLAGQRRASRSVQGRRQGMSPASVQRDVGTQAARDATVAEEVAAAPVSQPVSAPLEGGGAAVAPDCNSLQGCLIAEASPEPSLVADVELSMFMHPASSAKAGLLVVKCTEIAAQLCAPGPVKRALEKARQETADSAATAVALAIVLARELDETHAGAGTILPLFKHGHARGLIYSVRSWVSCDC